MKVVVFIQYFSKLPTRRVDNTKCLSEKYDREEDFINDRIEETCSHQKLSVKEVIYFYC